MTYRDDRDALRSEVDELQQELGAARADQERFQRLEQRLEAAKREMQALEAELGRARKKPKRVGAILVPLAVVFVVAVGAAMFLGRSPPPIPAMPARPAAIEPKAIPPAPIEPTPSVVAVPEPTPRRTVHVTWTAVVTKSTEPSIHPGTACKIDANAVSHTSGVHMVDVAVSCGAHALYDERGHLNGVSMLDSDATQHPGAKAGTWTYELVFSDAGTRGATRNQAKLDSTLKLGKVWSDNMPDFRIDLAIKSGSEPVDVAIMDEKKSPLDDPY